MGKQRLVLLGRLSNILVFGGRLPLQISDTTRLIHPELETCQRTSKTQQHNHQHSPLTRDELGCLNRTLVLEIILLNPDEIYPWTERFQSYFGSALAGIFLRCLTQHW